jgi:hypothetical protein
MLPALTAEHADCHSAPAQQIAGGCQTKLAMWMAAGIACRRAIVALLSDQAPGSLLLPTQ